VGREWERGKAAALLPSATGTSAGPQITGAQSLRASAPCQNPPIAAGPSRPRCQWSRDPARRRETGKERLKAAPLAGSRHSRTTQARLPRLRWAGTHPVSRSVLIEVHPHRSQPAPAACCCAGSCRDSCWWLIQAKDGRLGGRRLC